MSNNLITIVYRAEKLKSAASNFALQHGYPLNNEIDTASPLNLLYTEEHLELVDTDKNISIFIDFLGGNSAHRQQFGGGRGQSIAKAIGLKQGTKPPTILDATAGLAKDAYVLACLGCPITLLERSPIIVEMIKDAIKRAEENEHFCQIINVGFNIIAESSIDYLSKLLVTKNKTQASESVFPDVIYLDPMYPHRKKSAAVKKNMQILQKLLGQDNDSYELLDIALNTAKKRVVVKRPKGAGNLNDTKPTYAVESKNTRYDVYIIQKND